MKVLEYKEWRKFNKVIQKAIEACTESQKKRKIINNFIIKKLINMI